MDSSAALQMPVQEFQNILHQRSIVITNCTTERLQFNLQGLGKLADVDHQMDIQGDSSSFARPNMMMNVYYRPNNSRS